MVRFALLVVCSVCLAACTAGNFKVGKQEYRQQVRTLGVVPVLIDTASAVTHPRAQEVVGVLQRTSTGQHQHLIDKLKAQKGYFDVRPVSGSPELLFERLVRARQWQEGPGGPYAHYDYHPATVAELTRKENVDALLVVVLNGAVRKAKRWDRTRLSYLEAPFSSILVTAAVVLPSGEVLWEYKGSEPFLDLQYPAFDEAYYNLNDQIAIHFITLEGVERRFQAPGRKWFKDTELPQPYQQLFGQLASDLKPGLLNPFAGNAAAQ